MEIYNLSGEKIYAAKLNSQSANQIDLSDSPNGIYIVKIYEGEKIRTEKNCDTVTTIKE